MPVDFPTSGVPMQKVIEIALNASFGITRRAYDFSNSALSC